MKRAGVPESSIDQFKEMADCLPNLQLLEGVENVEKLAKMPSEWIVGAFQGAARSNYCDNHIIGDLPESLADFGAFFEARRIALRARIVGILGGAKSPDL